jgi:hypothetical protein
MGSLSLENFMMVGVNKGRFSYFLAIIGRLMEFPVFLNRPACLYPA